MLTYCYFVDFVIVVEVVAQLGGCVGFGVELNEPDVVEIRTAFYHWDALDELFHYHVVVSPEDQIYAFDPVGEFFVSAVAHVGQGDDHLTFLVLSEVLCRSGRELIAILVLKHSLVFVREYSKPIFTCNPEDTDPEAVVLLDDEGEAIPEKFACCIDSDIAK